MRTETIGGATLHLCDCREMLAAVQADVLITDPVWPNCPRNTIPGSDDPWGLWRETCARLPELPRMVVCMRSDSDPRFPAPIPASLPFFRTILLPYVMPGYVGRKLGGDEIAYWFGTPVVPAKGRHLIPGRAPAAQPNMRPPNGHPMSRVQSHVDWLVSWASDAGERVLDPFMGSGTTGVACAKLGRPFVGIEVDPHYFELACRRLEAALRQGDMLLRAGREATKSPARENPLPTLPI